MKGNVSKIVSDKGAASEQYIDATVGTALKNSKEAKEDASAARTIAQDAFYYSDEALGKITNAEVVAMQAQESAEFAKRAMEEHKSSPILDHPDGSVTVEKLSDEVKEHIEQAFRMAESATEKAYDAKDVAQSAKASADIAVKESENAYEKSLAAYEKASVAENIANTAKNKSETAEQRATSAEAKADTAVAAAGSAVQKAETVHGNLEEHINNSDVHTSAEEKADVNERIHTAQLTAEDAKDEAQNVYSLLLLVEDEIVKKLDTKADKPILSTSGTTALIYDFAERDNNVAREGELESVSFVFTNDAYDELFISELTFDSGDTPTVVDFPYEDNEVIINWYGTDCAIQEWTDDEGNHNIAPIFQPSANTRYNIMFWFDGADLVGKVHGYVPANRNVVS